jgi:hypothetical protein
MKPGASLAWSDCVALARWLLSEFRGWGQRAGEPRRTRPDMPGAGDGWGWRVWHSQTTAPHSRHPAAPNDACPADYRPDHPPPITPTTAHTAKHQRLKEDGGYSPALNACLSIKTNGIDSRSEQPMSANRDERARVKGGFPSKVWAMTRTANTHVPHRPKFLRDALTRAQPARLRPWSHAPVGHGTNSKDKEAEAVSEGGTTERTVRSRRGRCGQRWCGGGLERAVTRSVAARGVRSFKSGGGCWWLAVRGTRRPGRRPLLTATGSRGGPMRSLEFAEANPRLRQHERRTRAGGGGRLAAAPSLCG